MLTLQYLNSLYLECGFKVIKALLTRYTTFYLQSIGTKRIGTQFGINHNVAEEIYRAIPINHSHLNQDFLNKEDINEMVFTSTREDYAQEVPKIPYPPLGTQILLLYNGEFEENNLLFTTTNEVFKIR